MYERWRKHRGLAAELRKPLPDLASALLVYRSNLGAILDLTTAYKARLVFITLPSVWRPDMMADEQERLWLGRVGNYQACPASRTTRSTQWPMAWNATITFSLTHVADVASNASISPPRWRAAQTTSTTTFTLPRLDRQRLDNSSRNIWVGARSEACYSGPIPSRS